MGRVVPRAGIGGASIVGLGILGLGLLGVALPELGRLAAADTHADGSSGGAARRGSRTDVDPGGVAPGLKTIGTDLNVYVWGKPDPDSGRKAQDDGDWLEVKGGGGEVWSKGHVFDADHRSGASTLRGGAASRATVEVHVNVPPGCLGTGTCSDAITIPWDYCVSGDGIHVLQCTGTAVDITGVSHSFSLDPSDLSSTHRVAGKADQGASQRGSSKGSIGLPSLLKVEAHDEGTTTTSSSVEFVVTSSSARAKSGVVVVAKVTDTKKVEGGMCGWEYSSRVLDMLSAQALLSRADTSLGRFDVLHAIETSWSIVSDVDPSKSHGPHDLGPLLRARLAPETTPRTELPTDGPAPGAGPASSGGTAGGGATGRIVAPRGLASESGATPGLLLLETDRSDGPTWSWELTATPEGRVALPPTLVLRAGDPSGTVPLSALEAGPFTVCATLLDARSLPTTTRLLVRGESLALASLPCPETTARVDGWRLDAASGRWLAAAGSSGGGLRLERSGFAGLDGSPTTFELDTLDPTGVLCPLPPTATLDAGETSVRIPLEPRDLAGEAEVVVRCGDVVARVPVRSVRQALGCPIVEATVPVRGRAVVPLTLAVGEAAPRTAHVAAVDPTIVYVLADGSVIDFAAGQDRAWIPFEARAVGATVLRAFAADVPAVELRVTVVPAEIAVTRTEVTLDALAKEAAGILRLRLPEGVTWRAAVGEPALGVEVVGGLGTATLAIRVAAGPDRGGPVVLSVALDGAPGEPFDVQIDDRVREDRSLYRIDVR